LSKVLDGLEDILHTPCVLPETIQQNLFFLKQLQAKGFVKLSTIVAALFAHVKPRQLD